MDTVCAGHTWCVTGASAIVRDDEAFWFELTKPRHWRYQADGTPVVGVGAIGGSVERGESALGCLHREMEEELGVSGRVESAGSVRLVYEERHIETLPLPQREHPVPLLLTVSANLFRQDTLPECEILAIVTFMARISEAPQLGDLYGLLRVPMDALSTLLSHDIAPVDDILRIPGVELTVQEPLPEGCLLTPVWTMRSLQLLLRGGYSIR